MEHNTRVMEFVIVQVIQGKNFPSNGGKLSFRISCGQNEADMELECCTDNVAINQEVAFPASELDKILLELEQLTLLCTHISSDGTILAYDSLSLSFDIQTIPNKKWYKLKHASSTDVTKEPSLFISIFHECNGEASPNVDSTMNQSDQLKPDEVPETGNRKPGQLKPVLINDEYFLIEDPIDTDEQIFFNMSVTISFAENLFHLFPSKSLWPSENIPFEFRFSLFGSPIRFKPFKCLRNLTEIGERATAKLKGSPKCVLRFLKQSMQTLSILLYCEDIPIAESILPIRERIEYCQLEHRILEKLHLEPINISGIFPITSLLETETEEADSNPVKPQIGVVVTLSEAEQRTNQPTNQTYTTATAGDVSSVISSECAEVCSEIARFSSKKNRNHRGKTQEDIFYATALELEVWKEEQKLLEQEKQERSRASYMELLNSEYCRQAAVKEAAFQRRVRRIEELEKQLENAIQSTRQSELDLRQEKEHLSRQRAQLARDKSAVASEVERVTQSLTTKHKFELEAEKRRHTDIVMELRRKLKAQTQKSSEESKRIIELEKELSRLKPSSQ